MITLRKIRVTAFSVALGASLAIIILLRLFIISRVSLSEYPLFVGLFIAFVVGAVAFNKQTFWLWRRIEGEAIREPIDDRLGGIHPRLWGAIALTILFILGSLGYFKIGLGVVIAFIVLLVVTFEMPWLRDAVDATGLSRDARWRSLAKARWVAFGIAGPMTLLLMSTITASCWWWASAPVEQIEWAIVGMLAGGWLIYWQTGAVARRFEIADTESKTDSPVTLAGCGRDEKEETMFRIRARQIKLPELRSVVHDLVQKRLEYGFFGITSNGADCLYFMLEDGKVDFDFEALTQAQIPFLEKLRVYATAKGFSVVDTTYGNELEYDPSKSAPVLRINTRATVEDAASIGEAIMKDVFERNDSTVFDVVP